MNALDHRSDPRVWAQEQFGDVSLDDERRVRRLVAVAEAIARKPGLHLPQIFQTRSELKAAYGLFASPDSQHDTLQEAHRAMVHVAMGGGGEVLLLEDTTEIDYSKRKPISGLGPIGNHKPWMQGLRLHTTLAVRWTEAAVGIEQMQRPPVDVLGIADQIAFARKPRPESEARAGGAKARRHRERESWVWQYAGERVGAVAGRCRWVRVMDAAADDYALLMQCEQLGQGFAINAAQDRVVLDGEGGRRRGLLREVARSAPLFGTMTVHVAARPKRPARDAEVEVGAEQIWIKAPQPARGQVWRRTSLACFVVHVREPEPPEGQEPIEWFLLCDEAVQDVHAARRVTLKYASRYLIEEFHKALKTGLKVEELQLHEGVRIEAALAIFSVVALRLLVLREVTRRDAEAPAEASGLSHLELRLLRTALNRPIATVREVALALGSLGGHLNRKRDGMPGWITLWRGMQTLTFWVEGARLAIKCGEG